MTYVLSYPCFTHKENEAQVMNDLPSLDAVQQESDPDKPASRARPPIPLALAASNVRIQQPQPCDWETGSPQAPCKSLRFGFLGCRCRTNNTYLPGGSKKVWNQDPSRPGGWALSLYELPKRF